MQCQGHTEPVGTSLIGGTSAKKWTMRCVGLIGFLIRSIMPWIYNIDRCADSYRIVREIQALGNCQVDS